MSSLYMGLLSGSGVNAVDAVLADFATLPPSLLAQHSEPIGDALQRQIRQLCESGQNEIQRLVSVDVALGRLFATAVHGLLHRAGVEASNVRAIGSHGQTVRHQPPAGKAVTVQLGDPNVIADLTGITTVADFRRRDMAAGGQGSPLTAGFHEMLFRSPERNRVLLNIGAIAEITVLPRQPQEPVLAFATGPGMTLMDVWTRQHLGNAWDTGGQWAASGEMQPALLSRMLADPYFAQDPPKSAGREYFNLAWLQQSLQQRGRHLPAADVQATLCELTAASVAHAIASAAPHSQEVLACGGGVHNDWLLARLRAWLGKCPVVSAQEHGVNPDCMQALAFAWLAQQTLSGQPGNIPSVTGARHRTILGGIYLAPRQDS